MRVAIVAEAFLPNINGVTNSVLRVLEHLRREGHEAIVIAPGARGHEEEAAEYAGYPIVRVPTIMFPGVNSLPVGVPTTAVMRALAKFKPDVVHLASPFVLGAAGAIAARQLRIPAVAIYQTDVAGFATKYHFTLLATAVWEWTRYIHNMAQRTLAPSSMSIAELEAHGVHNIFHWGRGVDTVRFHPSKRSDVLRLTWDPEGDKIIVGFVGRLAAEKGVRRLASLDARPDVQVVIVGDGPDRDSLVDALPNAVFTGALSGEDLAEAYASFDVFVHTGEFETFCQTIQEALSSGVPVIGPHAGGPIDLVTEGVDGYLLEVDTFEDHVSDALDQVTSPQHYTRMCQAARDGVRPKTWQNLCTQLVKHYTAVIEQSHRVPLTFFGPIPELPRWAAKALGARV
ncbi:glycosyltransferase family 4 protein [Corynebacterium pyruviciproducens]|uniref:glycosyltransferase family 4 protein n=1 Tax=Corynebacterium pyruviciproducens TaxID=598660 RepID=UPI0023F057E9|nr:glycosyltransferase family 1 protein [Corynebacterium pyruviciproducens]MDH4657444.1 glycosyltransferase family 1 protein [Corynebacterium pyruviciproducens]MDK7214546.1 glycosyltransferase family 1 protein [Corynebacterium pyruviciproducens]